MKIVSWIFEKEWRVNVTLLLISFFIYLFYFYDIFLNLNSRLSSITGDSIKNYYTYLYHITNDKSMLHFEGMNYPFGEHVIYTDCQPLLTFVLRLLPFTHPYLIGILHALIYLSFIISPVIIYKIFQRLTVPKSISFISCLAISFLAPQFVKISGGHYALAYACIIPFSIYYIIKYLQERKTSAAAVLFVFHCLMFLLHPYLGLSLCLFAFMAILFNDIADGNIKKLLYLRINIICGLLPVALFKMFMGLTDSHHNRTKEPWGTDTIVENLDTILAPTFGPFQSLMEKMFNEPIVHFEGHTYLGFFTIVFAFLSILALPYLLRRKSFKRESLVIFLSALVLLLISFGFHIKILKLLDVNSSSVNQFRAVSRFAWFFYYALPILLVTALYHSFHNQERGKKIVLTIAVFYLLCNLTEAHYYFKVNESEFWKFRNFFLAENLNKSEKQLLGKIKAKSPQAILPIPFCHVGSETYERYGTDNSLIPSLLYSYHANLPILSGMVGSSRVDLQACKLEYSIVSPK